MQQTLIRLDAFYLLDGSWTLATSSFAAHPELRILLERIPTFRKVGHVGLPACSLCRLARVARPIQVLS
jgi:hypothetical protein